MAHFFAALIHLLRENAILGMQKLGVTTGVDPIDLVVLDAGLELGAQLGAKGQALLLAGEVHDVFAGVHLGGATGGELERLGGGACPGDGVFLFGFGGIEQAARAADVLRKLTVQGRRCHGSRTVSSGN